MTKRLRWIVLAAAVGLLAGGCYRLDSAERQSWRLIGGGLIGGWLSFSAEPIEALNPLGMPVLARAAPPGANVASEEERNQLLADGWPEPKVAFLVTGQQNGYLEPCGCTGLDNQKGGINRRDTLLSQIRQRGWTVVPLDVGNQVRRLGRQASIKFLRSVDALQSMGYGAVTLGPADLKIGTSDLLLAMTATGADSVSPFVSANVTVFSDPYPARYRVLEVGERRIGVTGFLSDRLAAEVSDEDIEIAPAEVAVGDVLRRLEAERCDDFILLAHASLEESRAMARRYPQFRLVVTAGGLGEPTLEPERIEGTESLMVQVGVKGMYAGLIGLYDDPAQPVRYQRIALSSQFEDSERMLALFRRYQDELKTSGLGGLGLRPINHARQSQFVGSQVCGDCHSTAFEIWENTPHAHATDSLVHPGERGDIPRHFDPECLSCHVTGWNPQHFFYYASGYTSLEASAHLTGSGCENCHGPGSMHVAAEMGDIDADEATLTRLRSEMVLPLERARDRCLECHDLDNSPDFHEDGAFEKYWQQVEHYGKD